MNCKQKASNSLYFYWLLVLENKSSCLQAYIELKEANVQTAIKDIYFKTKPGL